MKCFENFKNDRLCDLCKRLDENYYQSCVDKTKRRKEFETKELEKYNKLLNDTHNCPHKLQRFDYQDREEWVQCKLSKNTCCPVDDCRDPKIKERKYKLKNF